MKNPAATVSFVSRELYLTCMKKRMTSTALMQAMAMATMGLKMPQLDIGSSNRKSSAYKKRPKNYTIDLRADNVLRVVCRFRIEYFVLLMF